MTRKKKFILTEAAATIPLVKRILVDIRVARARLNSIHRLQRTKKLNTAKRHELITESRNLRTTLRQLLDEAAALGVEVSEGVRCEALFAFEHQWIGPAGDHKIRPAYFAYSDALDTIREWFFADWPEHRHPPAATWWNQFRTKPAVAKTRATGRQTVSSGSA